MIKRRRAAELEGLLHRHPAVALLGPRQSGKTTLALETTKRLASVYVDLESQSGLAMLREPELFLSRQEDRLVVIDEVHRAPDLFQTLRGIIDTSRRNGRETGLFLLLGSANMDLLKQSSESLAGRIVHFELSPFDMTEVVQKKEDADRHWVRGGFPRSFLAEGDAASLEWREAFIRTYLERDIPQFGPRIPAVTLRRFWTMLAHDQGGLLNASRLSRSLEVSGQSVGRYLDLMVDLLLVRRLEPWRSNIGKRMVKSPRIYIRDSGIVHALLELETLEELYGHPVAGASWEGYVVENILSVLPPRSRAGFYRTSAGAEIDLVLALPKRRLWAVEIKRSLTPKPSKGFWSACEDISPDERFIVYPGTERYPVKEDVDAISLRDLLMLIEKHGV